MPAIALTSQPASVPAWSPAALLARLEAIFDRAFGPRANPWRHLGALGFYLFFVVVGTGVWLYAAVDTSGTDPIVKTCRRSRG